MASTPQHTSAAAAAGPAQALRPRATAAAGSLSRCAAPPTRCGREDRPCTRGNSASHARVAFIRLGPMQQQSDSPTRARGPQPPPPPPARLPRLHAHSRSSPPPQPPLDTAARPPLWRQQRRRTLPLQADRPADATFTDLAAGSAARRCSCMSNMGAACSVHRPSSSSPANSSPSTVSTATATAIANRRATATMDDGQFPSAAVVAAAKSVGPILANQGLALRQVGLRVDDEEGGPGRGRSSGVGLAQPEHSRSCSQGSMHSRSSTSVQAWKSKLMSDSNLTPTQPKRSILPGLGPGSSSAAVSPLEDSAACVGAGSIAPKDFPVVSAVVRSASTHVQLSDTKQRRIALVASGRNQSPFATHTRTASAAVSPRADPASASGAVESKARVPAQVASAPSQTRRLNPVLVERAQLGVHAAHSRRNSCTTVACGVGVGNGSCMSGADEVALHAGGPSPASSAGASTVASTVVSAVSSAALVAAAAPTLGADVVSVETTRSLNAYLAAPKLMTPEEYRSTYPAFDAHNADYMAYRARWELAEREATASARSMPGSRPRASSRSLLCTPKNAPRSLNAATTTGSSVQSSPLSGLRVLTPTLHGAFGYGALSPDDPLGSVTASPSQSSVQSASLYLPPPCFVDGDVPADFVHKHSVMAFMVESSRPSSLRATPLKGFVSVGSGSAAGSLAGTPMAASKRLVVGDGSLLSPGMLADSELRLPSPQASSSSPDASFGDSTPCSPLAGSFKPKLFTSIMQAQKSSSSLSTAAPATPDAFVPVLPSTHVIEEPVISAAPVPAAVTSVAPSAAISAAPCVVVGGVAVKIAPSAAALASIEARRCFSDGITTRRLNAAQLELQKRMLVGSDDSGSAISPSTASPLVSSSAATTTQSAGSTVRITSRRQISTGGSCSPSLPGTPLEAEELSLGSAAAAAGSVSAAVLRSQAHISAITKSWQDRLGVGVAGEAVASDGSHHAPAAASFLPHVILDRTSPGHSRAVSQSSAVSSPRLSEDARYAAASASVARKLAMPAGSRLRAIKCMLPSDRAMTESTPVSLPPAHSPAAAINKRRLHLSSGGGLVWSPGGAIDGSSSPLPSPSPTAAAAGAAAAGSATSNSGSAPSAVTPSPTTRRRLLLQVPAATSSPIAPHSSASASAASGGGGSIYSFAQASSLALLPAIASATSLASLHSADPHSASYSLSSSSSSTLSSPVGSTHSTPSSSHRRMFSGASGLAVNVSATGIGSAHA